MGMHLHLIAKLCAFGYEAYLVGGFVRDSLLGLEPNDCDIVTNALPDQIIAVFFDHECRLIGKKFLVVVVNGVEIATYRSERYATRGKPLVKPAKTFFEDASRRDFTINAMAKDQKGEVIDLFGGKEDLKKGVIRAVGDPVSRFDEDPVRILRAVTFAARLGFPIDPDTSCAIGRMRHLLSTVEPERIAKEIKKMLEKGVLHRGLLLMRDLDLLHYVLPEHVHLVGLPQNPAYHQYDAFDHTVEAVKHLETQNASLVAVLGGLFHDVAKGTEGVRVRNPKTGQPSDFGHDKAGVPITETAVLRLGFGKKTARAVARLVRFHMIRDDRHSYRSLVRLVRTIAADCTDKQELQGAIEDLIALVRADISSSQGDQSRLPLFEERLRKVATDVPFYPKDAGISGTGLGPPGREIGKKIMQLLLDAQNRALQELKKAEGT